MRTIKAVIFDLDGTLVDSAPDIQVAINKLLAEEGRRPVTLEEVAAMIGDGAPKPVERAMNAPVRRTLLTTSRHWQGGSWVFTRDNTTDLTWPYPGVREALERMRSSGVRMGICTNKPERPTRELLRDLPDILKPPSLCRVSVEAGTSSAPLSCACLLRRVNRKTSALGWEVL